MTFFRVFVTQGVTARTEPEYRFIARSIFGGVPRIDSYALITFCSDVIDFLNSSKSDPAIGLVFDSYWGKARVYICS
jgi:hypothetical protein